MLPYCAPYMTVIKAPALPPCWLLGSQEAASLDKAGWGEPVVDIRLDKSSPFTSLLEL